MQIYLKPPMCSILIQIFNDIVQMKKVQVAEKIQIQMDIPKEIIKLCGKSYITKDIELIQL